MEKTLVEVSILIGEIPEKIANLRTNIVVQRLVLKMKVKLNSLNNYPFNL